MISRGLTPFIDLAKKRGRLIGVYHNHPQGSRGDFSPEDRAFSYNRQLHLWLTGTPPNDKGNKRYSPNARNGGPLKTSADFEGVDDDTDSLVKKLENNPGEKCKSK